MGGGLEGAGRGGGGWPDPPSSDSVQWWMAPEQNSCGGCCVLEHNVSPKQWKGRRGEGGGV